MLRMNSSPVLSSTKTTAMTVVVVLEYRFMRTADGTVWTDGTFAYRFWQRYLEVFDQVRVVARVQDVDILPPDWQAASGDRVNFAPIPYYIGLKQYLQKASQVKRSACAAVQPGDAVILRVASTIAETMTPMLKRQGHPYAVEVVADPYDVFAPGAIRHPLRSLLRWWCPIALRRQCATAAAAAYVTERALQKRYPAANRALMTAYSDVELPDEAFVLAPRSLRPQQRQFTLIHVGGMDQLYKAQDVLIAAVARCIDGGLDLRLVFVGDGRYRSLLEQQVKQLGIASRVMFCGQLTTAAAVQQQLQQADLFVLPSHQEGLPRAMVEAMAQGLPCIGSNIGGIPELLTEECIVMSGDIDALVRKVDNMINRFINEPDYFNQLSMRNWQRAQAYRDRFLRDRWRAFYTHVRSVTEFWRDG
jgi:hypothetical protein